MALDVRVKVLEKLVSRDYDTISREGKPLKGTSHKQACRFIWGENSITGVIKIRDVGGMPEHRGYDLGDYEISPDCIQFVDKTLQLAPYLLLNPVNSKTAKVA